MGSHRERSPPTLRRERNYLLNTVSQEKWPKKDSKLKPFGFCCSLDRFDPLSRYDQRTSPYKSSLTAITSIHECPVTKMQTKFFTPRLYREKKKPSKTRTSDAGDQQQRSKRSVLNYSQVDKNNRHIRQYLEDEIALAKDNFWAEKQRIYNEACKKMIRMGKKKHKKFSLKLKKYPRWYQDFSPVQMRNLMKLANVMRTDYEEIKTDGTQMTLIAIGVISTFFKLKPSTIRKLHKSCNLNSVDFLREIYRILTGNDFCEERDKKVYDCNEKIILSAIAFLTLPETVKELHKRLPPVTMPKLPPKPKLTIYLARQKNICPYKEELFTRPDWAGYRNDLQKWWQKHCKLVAMPKVILPLNKCNQFFINNNNNNNTEIKRQGTKDISIDHLKEINAKELQKVSSLITYDQKDFKSTDFPREKSFTIFQSPDDGKKFGSLINSLTISEKPGTMDYKVYGPPKPPGTSEQSWLGKKDTHYVIAGVSTKSSHDYPLTYEITGVANVTHSNSDERFFAVLNLGDRSKKVFPSGRENLSINWQEWLQNIDEDYTQLEEKTDKLITNVQAVKSAFTGLVCDNCCSCRQTRKFEEKLQQSNKTLINAAQNEEKNTHIVDPMTMQSSGQNPTESPIDPTALKNELKTNIISGVFKETGQAHYHISGIQEDKIHVSRMPELSAPQEILVRNVPPCSCAIQQMTGKDISLFTSKDDIPGTKEEGLCPGKKYRPDESGAYSCKTYPGDKSCRHNNPFMKEIMRMESRKVEKRGGGEEEEEEEEAAEEEKVKEKIAPIETIKKGNQALKKDITEKTKKFIPDPDYPAYDDPWNITRTAPAKITKTDYEATLNLTPPTWPTTTSLPLKIQERQNDISFSKEMKKIENNAPTIFKTATKQQTKSLLSNNPTKQSNKINKLTKHKSAKKKINITNEAEEINNRKREMAKLKNVFKNFEGILGDIQPAILPGEFPANKNPEEKETVDFSAVDAEEESRRIRKGPYGWRTKSEQELPAKKTLVHLCETDYPLETMAVHPGGRACQCRENRNKKKILTYNVGGLVEKKIGGERAKRKRLEEENRIIDGVLYVTPPISPRRSDEYIPEYDVLESSYDMCVSETKDKALKLIEKYSGPKSLVEKIRKKPKSCNCNNVVTEEGLVDQKRNLEKTRQELMESKSPEERWKISLKDAALIDYFTQRDSNAPCWTCCKRIAPSARPRRLKVVKPVCECKYERKIVERNEERTKWKTRQQKLKALKKQSFMHIVDLSRPMIEDKKFIISDVKRIPRQNKNDDIKYCISGVAEDVSMSPPQKIIDGLKVSTPFETPESSEEDILRTSAPHRHWSPMNIPPGPLPRKDAILKEEMERRKKARDEAFKLIYGDKKYEQNMFSSTTRNDREAFDEQKLIKKEIKKESHTSVIKKESPETIMRLEPSLSIQESLSKKTSNKIKHQRDTSPKEITAKVIHKKNKYSNNNESDIIAIMKIELKKMAAEGYVFAKLPQCHLMPQLQHWIMYREGIVFSETDKKNLMQATRSIWALINVQKTEIKKPSMHMTKHQLKRLTYDQADRIKRKVEKIRETFYSEVRKLRVSYAHMMWSTMEHGKFPSMSFKRTFFTYMPSKEADGHVYRPWMTSEVPKRVNFC